MSVAMKVFVLGLCTAVLGSNAHAASRVIPLAVDGLKPVTFSGIPPTRYTNEGPVLVASVEASSSFLLLPFAKAESVRAVQFAWKPDGGPQVNDAAHEASKAGDDAALRVGLILAGSAPLVPFFAPSWIKAVRDSLLLPSDELVYLVVGAKHAPGETWPSPYSSSITYRAVGDTPLAEGWRQARVVLPQAVDVVGVWLMADGDGTKARFTTRLKDLVFE